MPNYGCIDYNQVSCNLHLKLNTVLNNPNKNWAFDKIYKNLSNSFKIFENKKLILFKDLKKIQIKNIIQY